MPPQAAPPSTVAAAAARFQAPAPPRFGCGFPAPPPLAGPAGPRPMGTRGAEATAAPQRCPATSSLRGVVPAGRPAGADAFWALPEAAGATTFFISLLFRRAIPGASAAA